MEPHTISAVNQPDLSGVADFRNVVAAQVNSQWLEMNSRVDELEQNVTDDWPPSSGVREMDLRMDARFNRMDARFNQVDSELTRMASDSNARFTGMNIQFTGLRTHVDSQLSDVDGALAKSKIRMEAL
ncbi:hypothetical protein E4U48_005930 [Claviceps purpurea]|nr:hypothetical protein E4U25_002171 [Claviceps purpurea]KAG6265636.1 hypothetical protein E4U48_005930 [Claviceps purpurea]